VEQTYAAPTYQPFTPAYMTAPANVVVHDFDISWSRMFALQIKFWVVATILGIAASIAMTILWMFLLLALIN